MYRFESRVRFSETDQDRKLTPGAIIDYFQDCSTFQSEDLGVGFPYLIPRDMTWILVYWQIEIEEYPALGERIQVATLPYEFKGFLGKRNFLIEKEGQRIVKADSLWSLMDWKTKKPVKVPAEIADRYPLEEKIEMEYLPRKIKVTGKEEKAEPFRIQEYHLDCNGHVNNGQYVKLAAAYLPKDHKTSRIRAEYRNQAYLGNEIHPYIYRDENIITICLCDEEKKPYAVVEFLGKK